MPAAERVLDFSDATAHLAMRHEQLIVRTSDNQQITVPLAEVAAVILAAPTITTTQPVLAGIMRHGGAVIVCDEARQPAGMMLPLNANATQTRTLRAQANASKPTCKRLWKQIVQQKILAQAATLRAMHDDDAGLCDLARQVRSGDPTNVEAHAAQRYWRRLFDDPAFRRRRDADDQNRLLNYGYAVLRAAVGRAICASGLHPSIGVHHRSRSNPWCLADDLMEPYRPLIDTVVVELVGLYTTSCPLDGEAKGRLVGALADRLTSHDEARTVFDWISRTTASLAKVFLGESEQLFFPDGLQRA